MKYVILIITPLGSPLGVPSRQATRAGEGATRREGDVKNSLDGTDARKRRNDARDDASDGETSARGNFERSRRTVIPRDDDDAGRRQR